MKKSVQSPASFLLFLALFSAFPVFAAAQTSAITVGRVSYVEGDLLRYVPEDGNWVAVVRDVPFGVEDTLYSGEQSRAELIVPNGSWIRIGGNTQIQAIALESDLSEIDVASGVARFYNKSTETVIKASSPFGYVLADPGGVFDFYVGENSVEVVPINGRVTFVHEGADARYDLSAGGPSLLADRSQVSSGEGTVDADWDIWNRDRENFWAAKAQARERSARYLPPSLRDEGYVLEENGRWERVYYDGAYRWFWRPTIVAVGWEPFTVGRWTDWYGDQTWIPDEPFGYITHHFGNWVYVKNYWYWAPPVVNVTVGLPLLDIGFFWNPGRVSWIYHDGYVGWVPLAPYEPYYCHHPWGGRRTVVVSSFTVTRINVTIASLAYRNHAVLVNQNNFYRVSNYRKVMVTDIKSATIINNYRAAPVVNDRVIRNYKEIKERYDFSNVQIKQKPHNTVVERIERNQAAIRQARTARPAAVQERVKSLPEGRINHEAKIAEPKTPNYLVPSNEVNRPKSEIRLREEEIKRRPERVTPEKPGRIERPAPPAEGPQGARPERVPPPTRERAAPPPRPERAAPERPPAPEKAAPARPERVPPPERAAPPPRPELVAPERPPAPARVAPPKPESAGPAKPERVTPEKPGRIERPAPPAEGPHVAPQKAAPAKPQGTAPRKPEEKEESQVDRGPEKPR